MDDNSKPVTVVINCTIKHDKLAAAKKELGKVIELVLLKEKACQGIRVHEDPDNPRRLLIVEYWDSKEIFIGPHMQMPHMVHFLKLAETFLEGEADFTFWNEIHYSS